MIYADVPSFSFGLRSEDGRIPTFWLLLQNPLYIQAALGPTLKSDSKVGPYLSYVDMYIWSLHGGPTWV